MFQDCGKDGRKKTEKKTRRHDAKDEGDRGRNGREGRKDGELKEAEEDGGGDRGTLGVGRGKDRGVSWDLLVFFSPAESRFLVALKCADPPCTAFHPLGRLSTRMDSSFSSTASILPLDPERTVKASSGLSAQLSLNKLYSSYTKPRQPCNSPSPSLSLTTTPVPAPPP